MTNRFNFLINQSTSIALTPNNGIVLNGLIVEINDPTEDTQPVDEVGVDKCRMSFVDQPLTYDNLQGGTFLTRTFQLSGVGGDEPQNCAGFVLAEIAINCIGEGRGFCRAGNPCLTDADCDSNVCAPEAGELICQPVCGNGIPEVGETCDDGNTNACGTCNATCSSIGTGATCPVGTTCTDDDDCTGICDITTTPPTCVAVCGNGIVEAGEACDDGNTNACGLCNATCSAVVSSPLCPVDTGCTTDAVCTSDNCVDGLCQP
jgi:cysteine-rich repeat protein